MERRGGTRRRRSCLWRVDARRGREAHWSPLPEGNAARRLEGDRHRMDLGAHRDLPKPGLRNRDAARRSLVARARRRARRSLPSRQSSPDPSHPSGSRVQFETPDKTRHGPPSDGTVVGQDWRCLRCMRRRGFGRLPSQGRQGRAHRPATPGSGCGRRTAAADLCSCFK